MNVKYTYITEEELKIINNCIDEISKIYCTGWITIKLHPNVRVKNK